MRLLLFITTMNISSKFLSCYFIILLLIIGLLYIVYCNVAGVLAQKYITETKQKQFKHKPTTNK